MNYYQSNLNLLSRCEPKLASSLGQVKDNGLKVVTSKKGPKSIRVRGKALHSLYDPLREARELALRVDPDKDLVIVLGFGLGYHLFEILKRVKKESTIIVFEKSPAIFKKALSEIDFKEILNSPRISFSIGESPIKIRENLQTWVRAGSFRGLSLIEHPSSIRLFPAYYSQLRTTLYDIVNQKFQGLRTRLTFENLWMRNFILNLPRMVTTPGAKLLFNKFHNISAFIVGAGPSLEKNIAELALAKGKALIIVTDTALKPLLNSKIIPDVIVSCDAQDKTMGDFEGLPEIPAVLVAASLVYPEVLRAYKGPRLMFTIAGLRYTESGEEIAALPSLAKWCEDITEPKGYLQAGGSVSTLAFDLARNLGCNPIVFVGHDLAFTGEKIYTQGVDYVKDYKYMKEYMKDYMDSLGEDEGSASFETAYNQAIDRGVVDREFIKKQRHIYVPAIDLKDQILTSGAFYTYLKWFEDAISKMPDRLFINATEGGASISGTRVMRLSEVIDEYCQVDVGIKEILDETANIHPSIDANGVVSALEGVIAMLDELCEISHEGLKLKDKMDELVTSLRFIDILNAAEYHRLEEVSHELKHLFERTLNNILTIAEKS